MWMATLSRSGEKHSGGLSDSKYRVRNSSRTNS
jgi:hypothetical protein